LEKETNIIFAKAKARSQRSHKIILRTRSKNVERGRKGDKVKKELVYLHCFKYLKNLSYT